MRGREGQRWKEKKQLERKNTEERERQMDTKRYEYTKWNRDRILE